MEKTEEIKQKTKKVDPRYEILGKNVRAYREAVGLSREEIAQQLNFSHQQLQKLETGNNRIGSITLYDMSIIFNQDINDFFKGIKPDTKPFTGLPKSEVRLYYNLLEAFQKIKTLEKRKKLLDIAKIFVDEELENKIPINNNKE